MKLDEVEKKIGDVLLENGARISYEFVFPYEVLPDEVKLAISVLLRNNMKVRIVLVKK